MDLLPRFHDVTEGRILTDPHGQLGRILATYTAPSSYETVRATMRVAAMTWRV
jgi:hypothetical protein